MLTGVDGKSSARGACKEGIPSAEEKDEKQYRDMRSLEKRSIMSMKMGWDSRMKMMKEEALQYWRSQHCQDLG